MLGMTSDSQASPSTAEVSLASVVGGVALRTPIMPASGTFSHEMDQVLDVSRLGALVLKTTTFGPREGNPVPRVSETSDGMLNSIGLPGGGYEHFAEHTLVKYLDYEAPIIVSISAETVDQFGLMARSLSLPGVAAIEVNVSCPNIEADGKAFAMSQTATAAVVAEVRSATDLPLWTKLTPNTGEIVDIALAAQASGADAVVVANTILAMGIDVATREPTLGNVMGGLSGPAIKPIILRMVYQCATQLDIDVIGCGGIESGEDMAEYLLAGATAVQVGTASFVDPIALVRIEDEFVRYCHSQQVRSARELVGAVRIEEHHTIDTAVNQMDVAP